MSRPLALMLLLISGAAPGAEGPTWAEVQPIVAARCQGCHSDDSIAPFSFETAADFREHSRALLESLESRLMPPWPPKEGCHPFAGSRRLTDAELATLTAWVKGGMPDGPPAPAAPKKPALEGLPWVDSVLKVESYLPTFQESSDDYRCFVVDPRLKLDRDVIGLEIVPGAPKSVHHALLYWASRDDARAQDAADPRPGWSCFNGPGTRMPVVLGGWAPGTGSSRYPADTGVRVPAGKVLVLQVHYAKSRKVPEQDHTVIKLQFAKGAVGHPATILPLSKATFEIPAGAIAHRETRVYKLPTDATVWGLMPHMHSLGRRIEARTGDDCLIEIPEWDFDWHQFYFYADPQGVRLAEGEELKLTCEWDNPGEGPVTGGETVANEMCLTFLYLTY